MKKLMSMDPTMMDFLDSYWYWRIRSEATILDPENLPKKSYKQLCRDMGVTWEFKNLCSCEPNQYVCYYNG
eukprot:5869758-Amphidinium_carterae.2